MSDSSLTLNHAINYSVVMEILGFSQAKLADFRPKWGELIFTSMAITENLPAVTNALKVDEERVKEVFVKVENTLKSADFDDLKLVTFYDDEYPQLLSKIARPPLVFFARGNLDLLKTPCVSVVGSRQASPDALRRAQKVSMILANSGYTVVSGLAKGIDTAAHQAALKTVGSTIGVIGTPITQSYPKENAELQERLATEQLLLSQFPLNQPISKFNFPTRNFTMSGMSLATIIVEASETSGALHQATSSMNEGRLLFIMKSILSNKSLTWPARYIDKGAIILDSPETLLEALESRLDNPIDKPEPKILAQQLNVFQSVVND